MNTHLSELDKDELLHLAITASQQERHADAISFLKHAIDLDPNYAKAYYFLGAEHAQIGMFDRAIEDMEKSIELDPSLPTAKFQLGLLLLTSGRASEAIAAWASLDELGEGDPLYLFKTGLEHLANDKFDACHEFLLKGIEKNTVNQALNNDMQRILNELPSAQPTTPKQEATGSNHVFLSAYKNDDN